jgi:Arc/MetJ family transcription regulator
MLECMRTTIRLPDELYADIRRRSLDEGTTVTSFIEEALRAAIARGDRSSRERYTVVPFQGSGTQPGVDLTDSESLLELMES